VLGRPQPKLSSPPRAGAAAALGAESKPAWHRDAELGLSDDEARRRLAEFGPNTIAEPKGPSHVRLFVANLVNLFALLLWVGAVLAWIAGAEEVSFAIAAVILVNAVFAFVQEYRAEKAVEALRRILPQKVRVRREGQSAEVASEEVVPGDVLLLAAGDRVSADADLLARNVLRVDNSTLTGEAYPVDPEERVFAGTYVVSGSGEALVTATGMQTELGRIAELTQRTKRERSPLERELDRVTRLVAIIAFGVGAAFFLVAGALGMSSPTASSSRSASWWRTCRRGSSRR